MPNSNGIDLDSHYELSPEQITHFRERGFVKNPVVYESESAA